MTTLDAYDFQSFVCNGRNTPLTAEEVEQRLGLAKKVQELKAVH